jgi:hypothetical protein
MAMAPLAMRNKRILDCYALASQGWTGDPMAVADPWPGPPIARPWRWPTRRHADSFYDLRIIERAAAIDTPCGVLRALGTPRRSHEGTPS